MAETIYISNFKEEFEKLNRCISSATEESQLKCSSFHVENGCLRIHLEKGCNLNPLAIKQCRLTCVVQDELFRTIYLNGERVLWSSVHDQRYSVVPHSL